MNKLVAASNFNHENTLITVNPTAGRFSQRSDSLVKYGLFLIFLLGFLISENQAG